MRRVVPVRSPRRWSVATQTFALQVVVGLLVIAAGVGGAFLQARRYSTSRATAQVLAVATSVAATPQVVAALHSDDPSKTLQPLAEGVRKRTGTDFVVIMSPAGTRYSHPNPARIGEKFVGHIAPAVAGGEVVEDYTGTLGPSRRCVVPVTDRGRVIGLVSVGIRKQAVSHRVTEQLPTVLGAGLAAALLVGLGTALVTRRVRRQTRGLRAQELQEMYDYYDAVLHAVTDGLLLTDLTGRIRIANDEAVRLLGLPEDFTERPADELGLPTPMVATLTDDVVRHDELQLAGGRTLVVSKAVVAPGGRSLGYVVTMRDRTELVALTGELDSTRSLAEALRSQTHEASNRLHTIVSLIELGHADRALSFATEELDQAQGLADRVVGAVDGEPALTALLLGKSAQARERGITLRIDPDTSWPENAMPTADLVTVVGNLVDNAFDAVGELPGERVVSFAAGASGGRATLTVTDNGPGLSGDVEQAFRRGYSTKDSGHAGRRGVGLALVAQTVDRLHGTIEVRDDPTRFVIHLPVPGGDPNV
ncbi:sensor histidine kinase [Flexivirga oryzae]|uniref:Sensor histidine kinase regulating citrate/malate metabolism n=1 Tax=Flexivirga oryzae TaxID=1794944 RepID=A0A839N5C2_9MICO|nr:sensor histidine kinase [Flexivirga oryzae]MBB2891233.1 sensor histidine kinase regulating citrate/malate metabolism [Flexivirga oryzae]